MRKDINFSLEIGHAAAAIGTVGCPNRIGIGSLDKWSQTSIITPIHSVMCKALNSCYLNDISKANL